MLLAEGFAYSLALFACVAWPCLWCRAAAETCWATVGALWLLLPVALVVLNRRCAPECGSTHAVVARLEPPRTAPKRPSRVEGWLTTILLFDYLALCGAAAAGLAGKLSPLLPLPSAELAYFGALLLVGLILARSLRGLSECSNANGAARPPVLWTTTAAVLIGALAVGVAFAARPDWDDSWYLSAVQRYSEGGRLNREGFSLPGEDIVPPHMRLLAWELFGATLCRFSGTHPMISHHTLLPPVLVLLAAAAHWQLLARRLLPNRLASLAMIGVCGYWALGISTYDCPGSYLLTRTWQGKTMLWSFGLPLLVNSLWEFQERPAFRAWIACFLTSIAALAMSSSAVYLVAVLVPTFCAATSLFGRLRPAPRRWAAMFAVALPEVLYGLIIRNSAADYAALSEKPAGSCWLQSLHWGCIEYGSSELVWAALLPLSAMLLASSEARAYLIGLPALLAATVLNPFLYDYVAPHLTSYHTYYRLFWLVPFGLGLGATLALLSVALASSVAARPPWVEHGIALACCLALVCGLTLLPGRRAWSNQNEGPFPGLCFVWGENAYKVPGPLLRIIKRIERDGAYEQGRLLLPEHLAQFVVPYTSKLQYVSSRPTHTVEALSALGRPEEGIERVMLVNRMLGATGTEYLVRQTRRDPLGDAEANRLLRKYNVWAILIDHPLPRVKRQLAACGFKLDRGEGSYEYWRRQCGVAE